MRRTHSRAGHGLPAAALLRAVPAIALLCALAALCCALTPIWAETGPQAGETLIVGVPADRCPVFYPDAETGEVTGIGADLMRAAAAEAGYDAVFRFITEETLKDALDSDAYDVLLPFGSAIKSAAGRASVVSDNLFQTPFTLLTADRGELPPLNELRVGMLRSLGGGAETVRALFPGIEITMYETMAESVKALRAGAVDALLHNSYVWSYVLHKPAYSDLSVQPSAMFSMDFRAGTADSPEGRARIERLNGGIARLTDARRQAVVLDHTTRRLYRYDLSDYLYQYGLAAALIALLLAALIVIVVQKQRALRREQEEKLRELIDHDPLTGVLSMNGFRRRVEELLRAHPDIPYILTYVNIRNFKYINDSLGMAAGDELLRFYAERTCAHLSDEETLCRIDADRFAVFSRADGEESLRSGEQDVLDSVRSYFTDRGKENRVQLCGGIYVLTPEDYQTIDVDHMLDFARVAEQRVRETRNDGYAFYNPEQWEKGKHAADVINHLPAALSAGDIQVWYQPQVDFATGRITGAEALCRWDHSVLGWLRPSDFITTLEDSGLIYELDRYVWERVCRDLQRWAEQGKQTCVSVNVSRRDVREDRDVPAELSALTQRFGLSPDLLRVEITETAFVENPALLIRTTERLHALGFRVDMDDFGSGYSSLHMLKEVPLDRIKLDLQFLADAGDAEKGRIIVSHMIGLVRALGMELITEGVETEEQARFLLERGSSEMQGFWFYKPMPVEDFEKLL